MRQFINKHFDFNISEENSTFGVWFLLAFIYISWVLYILLAAGLFILSGNFSIEIFLRLLLVSSLVYPILAYLNKHISKD